VAGVNLLDLSASARAPNNIVHKPRRQKIVFADKITVCVAYKGNIFVINICVAIRVVDPDPDWIRIQ
jgi:hypothetical protein